MADGSQTIEPGKSPPAAKPLCLTNEQFDELSLLVSRALALSDVLNTMANGGDVKALHQDTLATYSGMLYEALHCAREVIDASIDASIASKECLAELNRKRAEGCTH
jgi:hypothetical protein